MAETIQQLLRERVEDDSPAVLHDGGSTSWREHLADSSAEAAALIALLETDRPAHVGVLLGNTPQMLRAMAGAALGGYVLCGINTTRRGAGLAADVRRAECQVLLTDAEHRHLVEPWTLASSTVSGSSTRLRGSGPSSSREPVGSPRCARWRRWTPS